MCLRFPSVYGKNDRKNIELSPINGLEPAAHEKGRVPISNRLRPKEIFERDRCASGWSDIYDHSTNPVNTSRQLTYNQFSCSSRTAEENKVNDICILFLLCGLALKINMKIILVANKKS